MPLLPHCLVAAQSLALIAASPALAQPAADTLRLEVGAPEVDGRIYAPHAARVIVRVGAPDGPQRAEWTNELTLGDSAGRPVMRWVTRGTQTPPGGGAQVTWELHQTYDAVTLAPYGFLREASNGARTQLTIDGKRVRGTTRTPADSAPRPVDYELERLGFVASASDLVPLAVKGGMKEGMVMTAPLWSPGQPRPETRVFSVIGEVPVTVEGTSVRAWKIEERRQADRALTAVWYMTTASPYMVYGEVPLPDGRTQYMSEVAIPMSGKP